jgi:hypothetical protein
MLVSGTDKSTKGAVKANVILDNGATLSLVSERVAKKLKLQGILVPLSINTVGEEVDRKMVTKAEIKIHGADRGFLARAQVYVIPDFVKVQPVDWNKAKQSFAHLKNIEFPAILEDKDCQMLIGNDNPEIVAPKEAAVMGREGKGDPFAIKTALGWRAAGTVVPIGDIRDEKKKLFLMEKVDEQKECQRNAVSKAQASLSE